MEDKTRMIHKVYLNARKSAVLSGVRDVLSFDAKEVYLETEQGVLLIQGDELHVNRLSLEKGEIDIDGRIDSFAYSDREETQKKAASGRQLRWMMCGRMAGYDVLRLLAGATPCIAVKICFWCHPAFIILKNARWTSKYYM
ncbi:MAG: sporulation protein YabP [Clostridium sp.]